MLLNITKGIGGLALVPVLCQVMNRGKCSLTSSSTAPWWFQGSCLPLESWAVLPSSSALVVFLRSCGEDVLLFGEWRFH